VKLLLASVEVILIFNFFLKLTRFSLPMSRVEAFAQYKTGELI
jgi:hypothetical protein